MRSFLFLFSGIIAGLYISWPGILISKNWRCFNEIISKSAEDKISIKATLEEMKKFLKMGDEKSLTEIIDVFGKKERIDLIITFISVLELARLGKISAFQNEDTSEIYLRVISPLDNFDVREADGFDEEAQEKSPESLLKKDNVDVSAQNMMNQQISESDTPAGLIQ